VGGLSVMAAIRAELPGEDLIYFADEARAPWGCRSNQTIIQFVLQAAKFLDRYQPKHVVLACNTASAVALNELRAAMPHLRATGVIEPGARAAVAACASAHSPTVALLATEATVRSRAYEKAIATRSLRVRIAAASAPLLAPMVEEGRAGDDPIVEMAIKEYISPLVQYRPHALVLGCTHYHVYRSTIERLFPGIAIVDPAQTTATDVARRLTSGQLRRANSSPGRAQFFTTGQPAVFNRIARRMTGLMIDATPIGVDELESREVEEISDDSLMGHVAA
jgi:glutamate racemase